MISTKDSTQKPKQLKTTQTDVQQMKPSSNDVLQKLQNCIEGELVLLIKESDTELMAIPMKLKNKKGRVVISVDGKEKPEIWGSKFGKWVLSQSTVTRPLGFGAFTSVNKLLVSKVFYGKNEYHQCIKKVILVRNPSGDILFAAKEEMNLKVRHSFGKCCQMDIRFFDVFRREVIFCRQLLRFSNSFMPFFLQRMIVEAQPSVIIGIIRQKWSSLQLIFVIEDQKQKLFKVESKKSFFRQKFPEFTITSMDNKKVGEIRASLKDTKIFQEKEIPILNIEFTHVKDHVHKALCMAAMFLIKSLYFH